MALPLETALLRLKRMESALIRSQLAYADVLTMADYDLLRYALVLGRLQCFQPGAAGPDNPARIRRADVVLTPEPIKRLRHTLLDLLYAPLREQKNIILRMAKLRQQVDKVRDAVANARTAILAAHIDDFSADELDDEICYKVLVLAPGGGGGAGYVYVGLVARLRAEGILPSYIIGSSIGALLGGFLARHKSPDIDRLMDWALTLRANQLFSRPRPFAGISLPGLLSLHLQAFDEELRNADGSPLRLKDLEIPYDAMIAGVRLSAPTNLLERVPSALHSQRLSMRIAERMVQIISYFSPKVGEEVVLGCDEETRNLRVVDAIGLSSAIPAIFQYTPNCPDDESLLILKNLREKRGLSTFMDGGAVANVPARSAWHSVSNGRIGTRNAFYLALDCFHPQWGAGHTWLIPVTRAVQAQLPAQRPYYDWLVRFQKTPSPVNLLPSKDTLDKAFQWGWEQADEVLPQLREALRPLRRPNLG